MIKLNDVISLKLAAIGFDDEKIIIINFLGMEIHQKIKIEDTVYSLAQFKEDQNI